MRQRKFIQIVQVQSTYSGIDAALTIEELPGWQIFVNTDYIASFGIKAAGPDGYKVPLGFINLAVTEEEYNLSYTVSADTITRLRELLDE